MYFISVIQQRFGDFPTFSKKRFGDFPTFSGKRFGDFRFLYNFASKILYIIIVGYGVQEKDIRQDAQMEK